MAGLDEVDRLARMSPVRLLASPLRRTLAALLVMALLAAQALGVLHRAAHAHGPHDEHAADLAASVLFDQHEDRGDCRLFDQLAQADAAAPAGAAAPERAPAAAAAAAAGSGAPSARPADCRARGPPDRA
jgi:hypothetical protein